MKNMLNLLKKISHEKKLKIGWLIICAIHGSTITVNIFKSNIAAVIWGFSSWGYAGLCYFLLWELYKYQAMKDFAERMDDGINHGEKWKSYNYFASGTGYAFIPNFQQESAINMTTPVKFWKRLWYIISNPFLYIFKGKRRW